MFTMLSVGRHLAGIVRNIVHRQGAPSHGALSTVSAAAKTSQDGSSIEVTDGATPHKFNLCWLRDNCKCPECIHPVTGQKITDTRILGNVQAQQFSIQGTALHVDWVGGHKSIFDVKSLLSHYPATERKSISPVLWDAKQMKSLSIAPVAFDRYMSGDDGVADLMTSLLKYGFARVKDVPCTLEMAEQTMEKVGPLMVTHEDRQMIIGDGIHLNDMSYTNEHLTMHTDMPFMMVPSGAFGLHCLARRECVGGVTLVTDGFRVARDLQRLNPEGYRLLCTTPRRLEHNPPGIHYANDFPVLNTDPVTGDLALIRYGIIHLKPLPANHPQLQAYYNAMVQLDEMMTSPEYTHPILLEEGDQLYINNHRMTHGRTGFQGHRRLVGSSITMDDVKSRARLLGLLH